MIDNQTSMLNSHTSKTSTNQNVQSNSINNHTSQLSNPRGVISGPQQHQHQQQQQALRRREFVEPKPKSTKKQQHHQMEGTFTHQGNIFSKSSKNAINTDSMDKISAQGQSLQSHNEKLLAAQLDNNVLDYSPFNFLQGINPRRLVKGRSLLGKSSLIEALKCTFCNCVIVQGQECDNCEGNFCSPCIKQWYASDSAKIYSTPCKCPDQAALKNLNKLKQEYLNQIRFKCNNQRCTYQLTYDELLLGTHELDDCNFMNIVCEGCGMRIFKQDQIRHESIECSNPIGKCTFCQRLFGISEMLTHRRECGQRSIVKVEYQNNPEVAANTTFNQSKFPMLDFDHRPDQEYRPSGNSSGSKSNRQKSSSESKTPNQVSKPEVYKTPERPSSNPPKESKKVSKAAKRAARQSAIAPQQEQQPVITLCEFCNDKINGPVQQHNCNIMKKRASKESAQEKVYNIPITEDGKPGAQQVVQQRRANRGLGLISHTDRSSQVQNAQPESMPPATQSTSRKENNTTTGIVYTQSSAHPVQSQTATENQHTRSNKNKACIIIDDDSGSDVKEKFSSQPVGTQPLEVAKYVKPIQQTDEKKHNLKRRSRSRNSTGFNQEELFKEALAQKKEKELIKHQTNFQEHSSGLHLSELERSGSIMQHQKNLQQNNNQVVNHVVQVVQPQQVQQREQQQPVVKVSSIFSSGRKNTKIVAVAATATTTNNRNNSRFKTGHQRSSGSAVVGTVAAAHLNPRKISASNKRLTRQQAKNKKQQKQVEDKSVQQQEVQQDQHEVASSCMEYDLESGQMQEKTVPQRSKELEQIIAASSSSNILEQRSKDQPQQQAENDEHYLEEQQQQQGVDTDSDQEMVEDDNEDEDDDDEEEDQEVADDQQESISETGESMVVQTCQNQVPHSSIIAQSLQKNTTHHSALNVASGAVGQYFQVGGRIKKIQNTNGTNLNTRTTQAVVTATNNEAKQPNNKQISTKRSNNNVSNNQQASSIVPENSRRSSRHSRSFVSGPAQQQFIQQQQRH